MSHSRSRRPRRAEVPVIPDPVVEAEIEQIIQGFIAAAQRNADRQAADPTWSPPTLKESDFNDIDPELKAAIFGLVGPNREP